MSSHTSHTPPFLDRAFPVPRSLLLAEVALSAFDGELRIADIRTIRGELRPRFFALHSIPELRLDGSEKPDVANPIAELLAPHGYRFVRAVVHEDEAYVFSLVVPSTDMAVMRSAIESSLEENVPIAPGDAIFEYEVVHVDVVKGETLVAVTVLSEKSLSSYAHFLEKSGVEVVAFDTEARCLARALVPAHDDGVHAILHIGRKHSVMAIVERGVVSFSSSIGVGSADVVTVVSKSLSLSAPDAEKLILERGFEVGQEDVRIFDASMPVLSTLHDEVGKMLVYWKTKSKHASFVPISDIIISGSYGLLNGVAKYISVTSQLPVRVGSVWTNVLDPKSNLPDLSQRDSLGYGTVIGALIQS